MASFALTWPPGHLTLSVLPSSLASLSLLILLGSPTAVSQGTRAQVSPFFLFHSHPCPSDGEPRSLASTTMPDVWLQPGPLHTQLPYIPTICSTSSLACPGGISDELVRKHTPDLSFCVFIVPADSNPVLPLPRLGTTVSSLTPFFLSTPHPVL